MTGFDNSHFPRHIPFNSERLRYLGAVLQRYKAHVTPEGEPAMQAAVTFQSRAPVTLNFICELDTMQPEELNLRHMCELAANRIAEHIEGRQ